MTARPPLPDGLSDAAGDLTVTLTMGEGEPLRLRDVGGLCTHLNGLLQAIGEEVAPETPLDWTVRAIGLVGDKLSVAVRSRPRPKRTRRKAATA